MLQREPELAQQLAAQIGADEQALNLTRPIPVAELEGRVIDPNERKSPESDSKDSRQDRRSPRKPPKKESTDDNSGHEIDFVA